MARIEWAVLCERAFFDRQHQLCLIGIVGSLAAPSLPMTLQHTTLVARLTDINAVEDVALSVGMVTPTGQHRARTGSESVNIVMVREYAIATLQNIPLSEEGVHHFQIQLRGQPAISLGIPVRSFAGSGLSYVQ